MFCIKLSKDQEKYYDAIKWLLDPLNRAMGRSYLLAAVYIELAIHYAGATIEICDHHPTRMADENLMVLIKSIVSKDKELLKSFTFTRTSIKFATAFR